MRKHVRHTVKHSIIYGVLVTCIYMLYLLKSETTGDDHDKGVLTLQRNKTQLDDRLQSDLRMCKYTGKAAVSLTVDNITEFDWARLEDSLTDVKIGGRWAPPDCLPGHNVAFVLPYRDRNTQLFYFLKHMHPFMKRQNIAYTFYVVEQVSGKVFNRGLVKNAGFLEVTRLGPDHGCVVFHDIDLLPLDGRNVYSCPQRPRHMCLATNYINDFMPLYKDDYASFGGVVAFNTDIFKQVNGYSNIYVGWGAEDDDLLRRVQHHGMKVERYPDDFGRYFGVKHESEMRIKQPYYPANKFKLLRVAETRISRDGLNTSRYHVINVTRERLFTRILIDVDQDSYIKQAVKEELVYKQMYGNLSPYWKKLNYTPKPYFWKSNGKKAHKIK